jgi:hypothetical protein
MVSNQHIRLKKEKKKIHDVKLLTTNRTTVHGTITGCFHIIKLYIDRQ